MLGMLYNFIQVSYIVRVIEMLMQEELKEKLKKVYGQAKEWLRKTNLKGAVLLALLPTGAAASSKTDAPANDSLPDKIEKTLQNNDSTFAKAERTYVVGDSMLNVDKAAEAVSQMTIGELLDKGLVDKDAFLDYEFTAEDFQQMKPSGLGEQLEKQFKRFCGNKKPQGKCLRSVRETVYKVTGKNIETKSHYAKEWWQRVDEREDAPFVVIGKMEQVKEGGSIKDVGNIKKLDMLSLQGVVIVVDGKAQPAGHVTFFGSGNYGYCDGKESKTSVLQNMDKGRYKNKAWALMPKDTKVSSIALAKSLVEKIMSTNNNAVDLSLKLASADIPVESLLNQPLQNTLLAERLKNIRDALAREQERTLQPENVQLAKAESKRGQPRQLTTAYLRTHNNQVR